MASPPFTSPLSLHSCNDPDVSGIDTCVGNFTSPETGVVLNRTWTTPWPNFDNVGNSLIVCFLVATLNGYTTVMMEVRRAGCRGRGKAGDGREVRGGDRSSSGASLPH